ncbi:MAG: hypothetical protein JO038_06060 [Alphaproteobacteria bacterium]|nr:hypothetical protein [Alphaproteobacteria bacterium]
MIGLDVCPLYRAGYIAECRRATPGRWLAEPALALRWRLQHGGRVRHEGGDVALAVMAANTYVTHTTGAILTVDADRRLSAEGPALTGKVP